MTTRRRWYQSKSGPISRWVVDVDFTHPDGSKERIRRTSPVQTRRGAEQYDREIRAALAEKFRLRKVIYDKPVEQAQERDVIASEPVLFAAFAKEFLEKYARANNKPSEVDGKNRILTSHLIPFFRGIPLHAVTSRAVENYKALKAERGLSPKTINNHLAVLGKLLRVAEAWDLLKTAPKMQLLRVAQHEREYLSFEEAQALIDAADAGLWRTMITVAVRTGLRLGELRALTKRDVDFERHQLLVRRAAWKQIVGSPKSGCHRVVDLSARAEEALATMPCSSTELIFADPNGLMLSKEACKWPLWRACTRAKLGKRLGWHALRHTFASHLVARGASLKAVQALLGHTDIKMTMRYAHLSPRDRSDAVSLLDSVTFEKAR